MEDNMIELYRKLSINNQRNEFSSLLLKTDTLLDELMFRRKLPKIGQVKNYDVESNEILKEGEALAFFYEDLWIIKTKILALIMENDKMEDNHGL